MDILFSLIAIILAVTVHEFSHVLTANLLGDPTGKFLGRLTLNPLAHVDPVGTVLLPLISMLSGLPLFGWGKPAPFNPHNLRHPTRDAALISVAGPISNFLFAILTAIPLKYLQTTVFENTPGYRLLAMIFLTNVFLCAFNLLPFPPLDGSKIVGIFIPRRFEYAYERYLESGTRWFFYFLLFDAFVLKSWLGFSIISVLVLNVAQWIAAIVSLGT